MIRAIWQEMGIVLSGFQQFYYVIKVFYSENNIDSKI